MGTTICPGCGVERPDLGLAADPHHHASGECWALYGELAAYTLTLRDPAFPHQYLVDAYAAQHVGPAMRPITPAFALIGLHLACDRGFSGRRVQLAHMQLARVKREWPVFEAPAAAAPLTAWDVLQAPSGPGRLARLAEWRNAVWLAWAAPIHAWASETCRQITH